MASQAEATGMPCSWVWRIESTAKPNFQFALDTLLDEKGRQLIAEMISATETIMGNNTWHSCLQSIPNLNREVYKNISNQGWVWRGKGRGYTDLGNYKYAFLYQLLFRVARVSSPQHRLAMDKIGEIYTSSSFRALPSKESLSMKGDVVEFALETAMCTGPAIAVDVAKSRLELNWAIAAFDDLFEKLRHLICIRPNGPPCLRFSLLQTSSPKFVFVRCIAASPEQQLNSVLKSSIWLSHV